MNAIPTSAYHSRRLGTFTLAGIYPIGSRWRYLETGPLVEAVAAPVRAAQDRNVVESYGSVYSVSYRAGALTYFIRCKVIESASHYSVGDVVGYPPHTLIEVPSETVSALAATLQERVAELERERDNLLRACGVMERSRESLREGYRTVLWQRNKLKTENSRLKRQRLSPSVEHHARVTRERNMLRARLASIAGIATEEGERF